MKNLTGNQTRQLFLDYFSSKGHMVEPGASLVPMADPTLLWINSGVAALKKYFDGSEKPRSNRITNAQKSIRTNDIENVGKTARHHTFFEMLGNFSIGDYFKEEAIGFAWEFLTSPEWVGMDPDKLYISVYSDDSEAYRIWTEVLHVDPSHILKTPNNFWQIGEGPSGPDTEIFYDRGEKYDPENIGERLFFEELENDRYIEVWNVVFSQYDAKDGVDRKDFKELPQKNIDTGMGLERLVSIIQGGETNYDTDLFMPVINTTAKLSKFPYEGEYKMAYRVIADHIRTVTFALADGANFSNEGRGYVLRRVLRRAVRFGIKLGIQEAFMYNLVAMVADNMKDYYPYVVERVSFIETLVKKEEETFHKTLSNGERMLQDAMAESSDKILKGSVVFKLYDTFGFPKELTMEIAEENGYTVDVEGFNHEMSEQKRRAKEARVAADSMQSQSLDLLEFVAPFTFIGYLENHCEATVTGIFKEGIKIDSANDTVDVAFDQSVFYAESGGQIADTGLIENEHFKAKVQDVKKATNGQFLHRIEIIEGSLNINDRVHMQIEEARRNKIRANHSSLHLLHSALKVVVGNHVNQAGSYVSDEYARFDFTHFEKVTADQLKAIENFVNMSIFSNAEVVTEMMSMDDAKNSGAIALFDEKYGDEVRVVTMGNVSKELCGGTHVHNTSEVGVFKIDFEESIGSGIRRIQVKTGLAAYHEFIKYLNTIESLASSLELKGISMVEEKVITLIEEHKEVKKELAQFKEKAILMQADQLVNDATTKEGIKYLLVEVENMDGKKLKGLAETIKNKAKEVFIVALSKDSEGYTLVVCASKKANEQGLKAGAIVKEALTLVNGKGGGRDDLAQGGSKDLSTYEQIKTHLTKLF